MTIKEFMNREYELTAEELKMYHELTYPLKWAVNLSMLALFGTHIIKIMNEVL